MLIVLRMLVSRAYENVIDHFSCQIILYAFIAWILEGEGEQSNELVLNSLSVAFGVLCSSTERFAVKSERDLLFDHNVSQSFIEISPRSPSLSRRSPTYKSPSSIDLFRRLHFQMASH